MEVEHPLKCFISIDSVAQVIASSEMKNYEDKKRHCDTSQQRLGDNDNIYSLCSNLLFNSIITPK